MKGRSFGENTINTVDRNNEKRRKVGGRSSAMMGFLKTATSLPLMHQNEDEKKFIIKGEGRPGLLSMEQRPSLRRCLAFCGRMRLVSAAGKGNERSIDRDSTRQVRWEHGRLTRYHLTTKPILDELDGILREPSGLVLDWEAPNRGRKKQSGSRAAGACGMQGFVGLEKKINYKKKPLCFFFLLSPLMTAVGMQGRSR